MASHVAIVEKNPNANAEDIREAGLTTEWQDPLKEAWQLTPVFFPGESSGQRLLEDYNP